MKQPISRADFEAKITALADGAFADHVVQDATRETRWYAHRPNTGIYSFEVVSLIHSRVLVHGDIPAVLFEPGAQMAAREAVRWLAVSHLGYISEKVLTGERYEWVAEVALFDLADYAHCAEPALLALRDQVKTQVVTTELDFRERLVDITNDSELTFGRVVNSDIIYAKQAIVALNRLLQPATKEPANP